MSKYIRWYNQIVSRGQERKLEGYGENHHIIPISLGGINEKENIVRLTAREHFLCHLLLLRIHIGQNKYKMFCAFARFGVDGKFNSRRYHTKKEEWSKRMSVLRSGEGNPNFGGKITNRPEVREKMRKPKTVTEKMGKHERTPELIERFKKSRAAGTAGKGIHNSMAKEENRRKVSESKIGKKKFWKDGVGKMWIPGTEPEGWSRK